MKIKTITCHEVYNYGASLQEYALLKYLEDLGHQSQTIHYKPPYLSKHFTFWKFRDFPFGFLFLKFLVKDILKYPKRKMNLKRKREFDKFSKKYINATSKLYRSNEELKRDIPEANVYICGSDQIWNSFFENGKDPAFYLDFVPDHKLKISYAASFAIDQLEDFIKDFVKEKVSRINHISVRESSGKRILEELGIENVTQVLDPVFLLNSDFWSTIVDTTFEKEITTDNKYIVVYDFDKDPAIRQLAERLKKENGWKIYAFNQLINYADQNFYLEGPEVFLSVLKNASCTLANSFHAVAFSLIFQNDLAVFNRSDKINTRMRDMLSLVDLEHLLLLNQDMVDSYKPGTIDYNKVQIKLNTAITRSKDFLNNALKS